MSGADQLTDGGQRWEDDVGNCWLI